MKRVTWIVLTLIAVITVVSTLVYRHVGSAARAAPEAQAPEDLIVTAEPALRSFAERVPWTGVVQSVSTVELTALVAGHMEAVLAADQAPVEAGTAVMVLGGPLLAARRARLEANVKSVQTQIDLATQTLQALQQNVTRQLATKSEAAAAQAELLKLQLQLRDAQLELGSLHAQTHVAAPIAGVFTDRRVSVGQNVKVDDVLGTIIDPNHLRIVASLFWPMTAPLRGSAATIRLGGDEHLTGTVTQTLPQASNTGATIVWIEGSEIPERLRPGQTVTGEITTQVRMSLAVPESAVVYGPREQPSVFVKEKGRYERRDVGLGQSEGGWVEILSGLERGQTVVTQGAYELLHREFSSQYRVED